VSSTAALLAAAAASTLPTSVGVEEVGVGVGVEMGVARQAVEEMEGEETTSRISSSFRRASSKGRPSKAWSARRAVEGGDDERGGDDAEEEEEEEEEEDDEEVEAKAKEGLGEGVEAASTTSTTGDDIATVASVPTAVPTAAVPFDDSAVLLFLSSYISSSQSSYGSKANSTNMAPAGIGIIAVGGDGGALNEFAVLEDDVDPSL